MTASGPTPPNCGAADFQPEKPYLRERMLWILRRLRSVLTIGLEPIPAPLNQHSATKDRLRRIRARYIKALNAIPLHTMCAAGRGPEARCIHRRLRQVYADTCYSDASALIVLA